MEPLTPPTTPVLAPAAAPARPSPAAPVPLSQLAPGQSGIIAEARLDPLDASLLRAMGLADNVRIKVFRVGSPCIVALGPVEGRHCHCSALGGCRIGLARGLADRILVTVLA